MSTLFQPIRMGAWDLPNRIIMAPLTRCRADAGRVPNALMAEYYRQRSSAGLILSEATSISPQGVGYPDTPGLWTSEQVAGWKLVTHAVHQAGGRMVAQLWHVGRISDPHYLNGAQPVSSSPIAASGHVSHLRPKKPYEVPRALTEEEIPDIIEDYRKAAENALAAGFDGVEIHGANGYLPHQFLNDRINQRTDSYGGSVANRARFMLEAVDAAISVWGADRVGLHLSPTITDDSDPGETYGYVASECSRRGLAFLFVRESVEANPRFSAGMREQFNGTFIANQELTRDLGNQLLETKQADAISFGRLYISNPDLVNRLAIDAPLTPPDPSTFYGNGERGYTDYPTLAVS
jgi:2,4-dienoyl-CoA reductase-like NADH-dependent reductase (Old Yellow Enzyme family)